MANATRSNGRWGRDAKGAEAGRDKLKILARTADSTAKHYGESGHRAVRLLASALRAADLRNLIAAIDDGEVQMREPRAYEALVAVLDQRNGVNT